MTLGYEPAAFEVLARLGKPMHYETIAVAALNLGLVKTTAQHPSIIFSTLLSRLAIHNASGPFIKTGRGVYGLRKSFCVSRFSSAVTCGARLAELRTVTTRLDDGPALVERSLFLLKRALSLLQDRSVVRLGSAEESFALRPASLYDSLTIEPGSAVAPLPLTLELVRAGSVVREQVHAKEVLQVFSVALALGLALVRLADESGVVTIAGERGLIEASLPWEKSR